MSKRVIWVLSLALAIIFSGCGGGSSSSNDEPGASSLTGRFVGISGVKYETTSGLRGVTDSEGKFSYNEGDDVVFVADDIRLGAVQGEENITVFSFQKPELVSQVLQAMDSDANLSNGIQIDGGDTEQRGLAPRSIRPRAVGRLTYEIDLQSVDPFSSRYRRYFEERGFTPQSAKQALINQVVAVLPNREKGSRGYWRRIMAGEGVAPSSLIHFADDPYVSMRYNAPGFPYWYRLKAASLYSLYLQLVSMQQNQRAKVLEDDEAYSKWVDDVTVDIDAGLDLALDVDEYIKGDIKKIMLSLAEKGYNYASTKVPPELGPTASLMGTAVFKCSGLAQGDVDKDELRECIQGSTKAILDEVILTQFEEKDPMLAIALHGATGTFDNLINVVMACKKGFDYGCVKTSFKTIAHDVMVISGNAAKTFMVDKGSKDGNNLALATEIFLARHYYGAGGTVAPDCQISQYYVPEDEKAEAYDECKEKSESDQLVYLAEKIADSGKIANWTDVIGFDYDMDGVEGYLAKIEAMYDSIYEVMQKKTEPYLASDGRTIDENAVSDEIQKDIFLKEPFAKRVDGDSDGIEKIEACFELVSSRAIENLQLDFKLYDHNGEHDFSLIGAESAYGPGGRTICGAISGYNPIDAENNPQGEVALLVKASFTPMHSKKVYTLTNGSAYRLGGVETVEAEKTEIALSVVTDADNPRKMRASVDVMRGGEAVADYKWRLDDPYGGSACQKESFGPAGSFIFEIPNECGGMLTLSVEAYNAEWELLAKARRDIDPPSIPTEEDIERLMAEASPSVYGVRGTEEIAGWIRVKGGQSPYSFQTMMQPQHFDLKIESDGKVVVKLKKDSVKSYSTVTETVQIAVTDSQNESVTVDLELHKISDLSKGLNPASGYDRPSSVWPSGPAKVKNGSIEQVWGLINLAAETISGVKLKKDPYYCDSVFSPEADEIFVGDMAPGEVKEVKVAYDFDAQEGDWFCQWNIYANIDGVETRVYWPNMQTKANLYSYFKLSDTVPPLVTDLEIIQNGEKIEGSFDISQPNDQISDLRIEFSTQSYFPAESTERVDIGSGIQAGGSKSFEFDIGKWPRNIVYWRLSAANGSGVAMCPIYGSFALQNYTPPTIFSAEPSFMVKERQGSVLVSGVNLPSDLAMSLQDAECYPAVVNAEGTLASMICTPKAAGKKRLYVAVKSGSEGVLGQENLYVNVVESIEEILTFDGGMTIETLENGLIVTWDAAKGTGVRYELYRSKTAESIGQKIYIGGSRGYTDKQVFDKETYYYTVKACNSYGCVVGPKQKVTYEKAQTIDNAPIIALVNSPAAKLLTGERLELRVKITDGDDDTVKFAVIWGDENHYADRLSVGERLLSHSFDSAGIYYWRAQASDEEGHKSNVLQGSVVVTDGQLPAGGEDVKALLGGKTWYGVETKPEGYETLTEYRFDAQMSRLDWRDIEGGTRSGTQSLEVTGNVVKVIDDGEENYFRVVDVEDAYVTVELIDVASGIIYSANGRMKLYRKLEDARAEYGGSGTIGDIDLKDILPGRTLYQHCMVDGKSVIDMLYFGDDGTLVLTEGYDGTRKTMKYRIEGSAVYVEEEGVWETHPLLSYSDTHIVFKDPDGTSTFYFSESDALAAPAEDCGGDGDGSSNQNLVPNIVTGKVKFLDSAGNEISVPGDAWIRITPKDFQVDGNWRGINCRIESSGSFGAECYIDIDEAQMRAQLTGDTTYQVAVYKNSIEPDEHHWDSGEDLYKYVGHDLPYGSWSAITVKPEDYQDNSSVQGAGITISGTYSPAALKTPNGGESWLYGESHIVSWDSGKLKGSRVDLFVLHDDPSSILENLNRDDATGLESAVASANWYRFAGNISNTGSYGVMTDDLQGSGNAYLVLVVTDAGDWDISDATFSLVTQSAQPEIAIVTPSPRNHDVGVSKTPALGG